MIHLWGSKVREDVEMSKSALAECSSGDIAVIIGDEKLDSNLVYLGCQLAKGAKRKVHFVHLSKCPEHYRSRLYSRRNPNVPTNY